MQYAHSVGYIIPDTQKTALCIQHRTVFIAVFDETWYTFLAASAAVKVLPASQVVGFLLTELSGEVYLFVLLRTIGTFFKTGYRMEEFHYGNFEYCLQRTEPFGYSHHRRDRDHMDDLQGCLSG